MWILTTNENVMELETSSPKNSNKRTDTGSAPIISREQQFLKNCKSRKLLEKIPDMSNTLVRTRIDSFVRGRLIGWIVEVLENLKKPFNYSEVFRTILIMDLYLKHYTQLLEDENMHIIGVTSMFISSKYETNAHLNATELTQIACHKKFENEEIFALEFTILKTLGFNVGYPSQYDVLRLFLFELFETDNAIFKTIEILSTNFLLFCLMDVHFNNYLIDELAIAVIVTAVRYYYSCKMATLQGAFSFGKVENFSKQEKMIIHQILEYSGNPKQIEVLSRLIGKYLRGFKQRFSDSLYVIKLFDFNEDLIGK